MNAKEYLLEVEKIDKIIKNKLIEKRQWLDIATNISSPGFDEKVQSTPCLSRMANAVEKFCDLEDEINEYIDRLCDIKKDVLSVIESLKMSEYEVLHMVYIQYHTLKEASVELCRSYSWITTTHDRALEHVQEILDERERKGTK